MVRPAPAQRYKKTINLLIYLLPILRLASAMLASGVRNVKSRGSVRVAAFWIMEYSDYQPGFWGSSRPLSL